MRQFTVSKMMRVVMMLYKATASGKRETLTLAIQMKGLEMVFIYPFSILHY